MKKTIEEIKADVIKEMHNKEWAHSKDGLWIEVCQRYADEQTKGFKELATEWNEAHNEVKLQSIEMRNKYEAEIADLKRNQYTEADLQASIKASLEKAADNMAFERVMEGCVSEVQESIINPSNHVIIKAK